MRIAILGATSQIAKDLILSFARHSNHDLVLFARRPEIVSAWLKSFGLFERYPGVSHVDNFSTDQYYDAVFNFVGVGNPAQVVAMGASIFDVTYHYDELALNYVKKHPQCRYLFLSSGAVYGGGFNEPVNQKSSAVIAINNLQLQDWYAIAKLHAECRHRSLPDLPIIDIRVFNYFSVMQDLNAKFLICDIIRAIQNNTVLTTSSDHIVRDYLHPDDFFQLVELLLQAPLTNTVVDCYTLEPVSKKDLLTAMRDHFGLQFEVAENPAGVNATGNKRYFYSRNRHAGDFGYVPMQTSLSGIEDVLKKILG